MATSASFFSTGTADATDAPSDYFFGFDAEDESSDIWPGST
jgi:hypothetical protein